MTTAAKLVQDDLIIMVEEDGKFHGQVYRLSDILV